MAVKHDSARRHLDARFSQMGHWECFTRPHKGWIRAIRDALGMTTQQLAKRLGVAHTRVLAIEKDEVKDNLKLSTLQHAAEALGCRLVYAIVPDESLEKIMRERARQKAIAMMNQVAFNMRLEDQLPDETEINVQLERLVEELLQGSQARLWDE